MFCVVFDQNYASVAVGPWINPFNKLRWILRLTTHHLLSYYQQTDTFCLLACRKSPYTLEVFRPESGHMIFFGSLSRRENTGFAMYPEIPPLLFANRELLKNKEKCQRSWRSCLSFSCKWNRKRTWYSQSRTHWGQFVVVSETWIEAVGTVSFSQNE